MTDYPRYTAYRYDADPTLVAVELPSPAASPPAVPPAVPPGGYAPAVVASLPAGVIAAGWLLFADGSYVPRYSAGVSPPPPPPPPAVWYGAAAAWYGQPVTWTASAPPPIPPPPAYAPRLDFRDARNGHYLPALLL